jgi:hypothetical protein
VNDCPEYVRTLLLKAVRRHVAEAVLSGSIVTAADCADEILETYPACELDRETVANEVLIAAAKAGLAVEFGRSNRIDGAAA